MTCSNCRGTQVSERNDSDRMDIGRGGGAAARWHILALEFVGLIRECELETGFGQLNDHAFVERVHARDRAFGVQLQTPRANRQWRRTNDTLATANTRESGGE